MLLSLPKTPSAFRAKDLRLSPLSLIGRTIQLFGSVTEVRGWAFFRQFGCSFEVSLPAVPHGSPRIWPCGTQSLCSIAPSSAPSSAKETGSSGSGCRGSGQVGGQRWPLFNHVSQIAAIDFFTVPTVTFRVLYVFLILRHKRRRVVHFNTTTNPTAQ